MKLLKAITLISIVFMPILSIQSQVYLTQGFESGSLPTNWTEENVVGSEPWRYRNGGHSPNDNNWLVPADQEDITRNPPSAYEGTYNAIFFKQGDGNERTKLVTPELDLLGGASIELSFYLYQEPWIFEGSGNNDALRVYYKVHEDSAWVLLHEYLDPVYPEWDLQSLVLPNPTATYYVAFEGQTRWGYGTCIDNVVIEDKGVKSLWISDLDFIQPVEDFTPSGVPDLPILRMDFKVFGNTDTAWLENMQFTSLNTLDSDLQSGGVKLYSTMNQTFDTDNPLGTPTDFSGSVASFTGLHYSLPRGQSYVWLAYDVAPGATHENILDVKIAVNGILANDTLYPAAEQSPPGDITIYESRYSEGFEGTHNWNLTGEFQVGAPSGLGGSPGNPDPEEAFRGTNVLGTDLTGLGSQLYKYEPNLDADGSDRATSPVIDVFYYKNLNLFIQRHLNIEVWDSANIYVSINGGTTWNRIWTNSGYINDFQWSKERITIPDQYSRTDQFKVRFQLGPTDNENNYSGWNIDDVYVTGEFITKDVGVSRWVYPLSGSGHSFNDSVTVVIRNFGGAEITDDVPVGYSFDGGTSWVVDNMTDNIPLGDSVTFTFPTKVDLSAPGLRPTVIAKTMLPGDQFAANDSITTEVYIVPTYTPPHKEDFESNDGYWRISGNELWEYGTPGGSVINTASSGFSSWAIGLTEQYDELISQSTTIFTDDFESDRGWAFTGEFERAIPSNLYPPYAAFVDPVYCIGTDISEPGQGDTLHKYENGINEGTAYTATSPAFDISSYTNLSIQYYSYINIRPGDSVKLEVSPNNGTDWYRLWDNAGDSIGDTYWDLKEIIIHDSLSSSTALRFRFSLFYSSASGPVDYGINIDKFSFFGDRISTGSAYITSSSYDLTGLVKPMIETRLWIDTEKDVDGATLHYSLDDGDNWTAISNTSGYDGYWNWYTDSAVSELALDGWSGLSGGWFTAKHLLPAEVIDQENVQFRFEFKADKVNNLYDGVAFDDVQVYEAPGDIGVTEILAPVSACELGASQAFSLRLRNYGIRDLVPGDTIRVGYYIDRSGVIQTGEETINVASTFAVGTTQDFDMTTEFNFYTAGDYQVDVFTIEADPYFYQDTSNDTLSQVIQSRKPAVELGPDIYTVRPDTIVLMAYQGEIGLEYLWQDSSTDSIFHVSTEGKYYVRVTNEIPCVASDTIDIIQLIADVGVTGILDPVDACELGSAYQPRIEVTNFGTDTLDVGDTILVRYSVDGGPLAEEIAILGETVYPDSTFEYTFTTTADMSAIKTYSVKGFTSLDYDDSALNDTTVSSAEVFGFTEIDLGADTIVRALEWTLDAGSGYDTYLWQDASTSQTFVAETTGWYKVTVKEGIRCENTDSIHLVMVIPDVMLKRISNPVDACMLSSTERLDLYVINSGTDTLTANDTIPVAYQMNSGSLINDTLFVDRTVLPGDSILFSSSGTINLSSPGMYQFTVYTLFGKDLFLDNDTIQKTIEVFGNPAVSLGADTVVNAKVYTLDAGAGFVNYLWQDFSTNQDYTVQYENQSADSLYGVTVTDANGCQAYDQVRVTFAFYDIGIDSILTPVSACLLTDQEELKVWVRNYGTLAIYEQIQIKATVDQGIPVTGQKTLTAGLDPGDSLEFTFGLSFDLSGQGDHDMVVYTVYGRDLEVQNDTLTQVITHFGPPAIDLGGVNDTLETSLPYTLDAGADYLSYTWNDVAGSRTHETNAYGWYKLEVTDLNTCYGVDSVYLVASSTGIADRYLLDGRLKVYPNPVDNILYLEYDAPDHPDLVLEMFDALGRKVMAKEYRHVSGIVEKVDVSEMPLGIYYLRLRQETQQAFRKIIIQ